MTHPKLTEDALQMQMVQYLCMAAPRAIIHHSPNEGVRGGKRGVIDGARRKKMGMRKGWPDLILLDHGRVMFVEVKLPGQYPDKTQKALHQRLRLEGHYVAVCKSVDDLAKALKEFRARAVS